MNLKNDDANIIEPIAFQVMAKPIGPICNLNCSYCFYLEKKNLYPDEKNFRMQDDVLEKFIHSYIESQDCPEVHFAWQGGEPTLLGVNYFNKVVELQKKYANGKIIFNAFQTNGTLIDDEWGQFLAENNFLVGISIDAPRKLNDAYRIDKQERSTFDRVMQGLAYLKKHRVEFNTLTVVNRKNSYHPLKVYNFLKEIGSSHIQFIPLVERTPDECAKELELEYAVPPILDEESDPSSLVTHWSVKPKQYGIFLVNIFKEWVRNDVGMIFIYLFEEALASWSGLRSSLCVFQKQCGNAMIIEHNGDIYTCDHYVYPEYNLGNVMEKPLKEIANSPKQLKFGKDKYDKLPKQCLSCEFLFACNGECPKHRFLKTPDGEQGLNYLCEGYKYYFKYIDPYMKTMTELLSQKKSPALIMNKINKSKNK